MALDNFRLKCFRNEMQKLVIVATTRQNGWDLNARTDFSHPLVRVIELLLLFFGVLKEVVTAAKRLEESCQSLLGQFNRLGVLVGFF